MTRRTLLAVAPAAALALLMGCAARGPDLTPREGYVHVTGGRIWYRIVGTGPGTPLLLIHGGPGVPSYYLRSLAALGDERPVIFYDQLGAGRSDHPTDTTLWRLAQYVQRLGELRDSLGLTDVDLYGHSFGTMIAVDYMLTKPKGVKSLILAGPVLNSTRFLRDRDSLRATLPDSIRRALVEHERDHTMNSREYQAAQMVFMHHFQSITDPWPPVLDSAVQAYARDRIGMDLVLDVRHDTATYDRTDRLGEITVPTLIAVGRYDRSTPSTAAYYQSLMPHAELVVLEHSAHLPMIDQPARYVAVLRAFLDSADAGTARD
ncbi:MAG TPA: proline iminopeptidase-family hydrolase [Gemmatimonadales bacterium]|nr:proline iminopeptidase-family hydrolase [Gemmatimonadales bacterium]